jgi:hypothetical protein
MSPTRLSTFTGNSDADRLTNNLENTPHALVLACLMDRQMDAKRACLIPYRISVALGDFSLNTLLTLDLETLRSMFKEMHLHRFSATMSEVFYLAIQRIHSVCISR